VLTNPTTSTLQIIIDRGNNLTSTELSISLSKDSFATQVYIQADGTVGSQELWQTQQEWNGGTMTVRGLNANVPYQFKVRARNIKGVLTQYSDVAVKVTLAATPLPPSLTPEFDPTSGNHLHVGIPADGNSSPTEYAIQYLEETTWLQGDGTVGSSVVWKTVSQWTASHSTNSHISLMAGTTYSYVVLARNIDQIVTNFSTPTIILMPQLGDAEPPAIVSVLPKEDSILILPERTIQIEFNDSLIVDSLLDKISLQAITNNLGETISQTIVGTVSLSTQTVIFIPDEPLPKGHTFRVTVATGILDISGNSTQVSKIWTFSTVFDHSIKNIIRGSDEEYELAFEPLAFDEDYGLAIVNPLDKESEAAPAFVSKAGERGSG